MEFLLLKIVIVLISSIWFLLSGLVAFRQHLQNLARTKGILELNKVQMLVEQMDSGDGAVSGLLGPQHHLHNLLEVGSGSLFYSPITSSQIHPCIPPDLILYIK